jgi:hypothetical protein
VILKRDFGFGMFLDSFEVDDAVQRIFAFVDVFDELRNASLIEERLILVGIQFANEFEADLGV